MEIYFFHLCEVQAPASPPLPSLGCCMLILPLEKIDAVTFHFPGFESVPRPAAVQLRCFQFIWGQQRRGWHQQTHRGLQQDREVQEARQETSRQGLVLHQG